MIAFALSIAFCAALLMGLLALAGPDRADIDEANGDQEDRT